MKVVIQRVKSAELFVENKFYSKIGSGLLVLVAVSKYDKHEDINWMANKLVNLRIFNDEKNQMNRSVEFLHPHVVQRFSSIFDDFFSKRDFILGLINFVIQFI